MYGVWSISHQRNGLWVLVSQPSLLGLWLGGLREAGVRAGGGPRLGLLALAGLARLPASLRRGRLAQRQQDVDGRLWRCNLRLWARHRSLGLARLQAVPVALGR